MNNQSSYEVKSLMHYNSEKVTKPGLLGILLGILDFLTYTVRAQTGKSLI